MSEALPKGFMSKDLAGPTECSTATTSASAALNAQELEVCFLFSPPSHKMMFLLKLPTTAKVGDSSPALMPVSKAACTANRSMAGK
jgi:hypothetical protein